MFILSGAEDLVPVSDGAGGTQRYRPRTEGLFARILHHRDATNNYWEVRSKDGLRSIYGTQRPEHAAPGWNDPAILRNPDPSKPTRGWGRNQWWQMEQGLFRGAGIVTHHRHALTRRSDTQINPGGSLLESTGGKVFASAEEPVNIAVNDAAEFPRTTITAT